MRAGFCHFRFPSVDRCNAAQLATTVSEYFRDRVENGRAFVDSMTRYACFLRRRGLKSGELSARRGYFPPVFDNLPLPAC